MAEVLPPDWRRCSYFFLYDSSKVRGEGDATREGICCFHPEKTPLDKQELICGQLAGAVRCISELSSSPVQTLRLRRNQFAIRMKDDFLWALGCSVDVPTVSVCELLDRLINLFCFYNGSVRQAYQLNSRETLAARWTRYLSHLQSGSSELHQVFSCLRTIDSTNVDPLLLLKAALILQACQRCPLVLAGCILFRGRVVSTQMSPELTMKVMVHESETDSEQVSLFGGSVSSTTVFLTSSELQFLRSAPVDRDLSSLSTPQKTSLKKTRLSRTLSDTPSAESEQSDPGSSHRSSFSPHPSQSAAEPLDRTLSNGQPPPEEEEELEESSCYHSFHSHSEADGSASAETSHLDLNGGEASHDGVQGHGTEIPAPPPPLGSGALEWPLVPMSLYVHRVRGLVLALLVEPHFLSDTASTEEVYHSSLASLNGLEAHLRTVPPGGPGPPGPYVFAHFDCVQSTMTTNLSGGPGGASERPFVRATSLLHSHFCSTETLQEAIIRSAGAAVYGSRSVTQETFFQQHGASLRNSGIPNHQDSAFSLPGKARHRLLKHGVNLL